MRPSPVLVLAFLSAVACTGGNMEGPRTAPHEGEGSRIGGQVIDDDVVLIAPPEEGAGEVPSFAWEPHTGAATYRIGVLDSAGDLVWGWEGKETSVVLGGVPGRRPEEGGPVITPGSSWSVIAFDGAGSIVATSEMRPVSP